MTLKERVKSLCKERGVSMNQTETDQARIQQAKHRKAKQNGGILWRYSRLSYEWRVQRF